MSTMKDVISFVKSRKRERERERVREVVQYRVQDIVFVDDTLSKRIKVLYSAIMLFIFKACFCL